VTWKIEIDRLEEETNKADTKIKDTEAVKQKAAKEEKEEKDTNKDNRSKEEEGNNLNNLIPTTEKSNHSSYITALLTRLRLKDSLDLVNLSNRVGLRDTKAVVSYKSSRMFRKTGIVCDTEIEA
jgi:hypothetical protein